MRPLRILCLLLLVAAVLPGCKTPDAEKKEPAPAKKEKPPKPLIPDASTDTNFQAFLGRLRIAVGRRDHAVIAGMMASDFGWRWEQPQPGNPFQYWDENNMWPELERVMSQRFTPSEDFMVSPPEFASDPSYDGPRAGMKLINGSWKFVYFVTGRDLLQ